MNSAYPAAILDWEPNMVATKKFADLLKEKSDGRINVEIFYNNQLAGQAEALDALARGTIDLQSSTPAVWGDKIPEGVITGLPFWNMGHDHTKYMLRETEFGKLMDEAYEEYGIKILFYWPSGDTGFISSTPIASPDDMKGLVVLNASNFSLDWYKAMGAGTASISYAEMYEGYLRGTVDAAIFAFNALEAMKLHEVAKYISVPGTLAPSLGFVTMSKESFESLPEDLQEIVLEVAKEIEDEAFNASQKLADYTYDFAEENGVEIVRMTKEAYEEFKKLNQEHMWTKIEAANERTKKMIEVINEENEKWMQENPEAFSQFEELFAK